MQSSEPLGTSLARHVAGPARRLESVGAGPPTCTDWPATHSLLGRLYDPDKAFPTINPPAPIIARRRRLAGSAFGYDGKDWYDWQRSYTDPGSPLARRIRLVQLPMAHHYNLG